MTADHEQRQARHDSKPTVEAPDAQAARSQRPAEPHAFSAAGVDRTASHTRTDTQVIAAGRSTDAAEQTEQPVKVREPRSGALSPSALLAICADVLDDLERTRIANENRLRSLTADGLADVPEYERITAVVEGLKALEHDAELALKRALRKHPLGPWVKRTVGIGEKQGARLLAPIGDPYIRPEIHRKDGTIEPSRPRTVSELWAYCGYHVIRADHGICEAQTRSVDAEQAGKGDTDHTRPEDDHPTLVGVAPSRRKGQRANWNAAAKMRAFLVAEACMKQRLSPYRHDYDLARKKHEDNTHATPCARCGPKGKPAQVGSPLSLGHQHARALRIVAKEVLRDLWVEAKRLHEASS